VAAFPDVVDERIETLIRNNCNKLNYSASRHVLESLRNNLVSVYKFYECLKKNNLERCCEIIEQECKLEKKNRNDSLRRLTKTNFCCLLKHSSGRSQSGQKETVQSKSKHYSSIKSNLIFDSCRFRKPREPGESVSQYFCDIFVGQSQSNSIHFVHKYKHSPATTVLPGSDTTSTVSQTAANAECCRHLKGLNNYLRRNTTGDLRDQQTEWRLIPVFRV
jgi:hypothetical protein